MQYFAPYMTPDKIGTIHLTGIGGIGISGIAELLHNLGFVVQGSDQKAGANTERLQQLGIRVFIGHQAENIQNIAVLVKSSAVKDDNPEIIAARAAKVPVVHRAEMLAEIVRMKQTVAIAGSHGKTTTTSLVAQLFESAKLNPTVINGGIINARGTNAYLGSGEWLIAEADESDGTFIRLPSTVGIVTNIDPEHLEHYGSFDALKQAFKQFIQNLPFYGFGVVCLDHPIVRQISEQITDRTVVTYGIESDNVDVKAVNIQQSTNGSHFDVQLSARITNEQPRILKGVHLPMPGIHNISNALAAIATMVQLQIDDAIIAHGFKEFQGVKRRFTKTGEVNGITIIDDYAHHPKEIKATLQTAASVVQSTGGRVIAVAQPHRYSRLNDLFDEFSRCFDQADFTFILEVYEAGEQPIEGINSQSLVQSIAKYQDHVTHITHDDAILAHLSSIAKPNDIIVFMGAGSVTNMANAFPEQLSACIRQTA